MVRNPIHNRRLYEVWGGGTQESADKWDEVLTRLYDECGITSQRQLANTTGVPESTLRSCNAFRHPHLMTYGVYMRVCNGLNADMGRLTDEFLGYDHDAAKCFDATFEAAKARTLELVAHFLTLDEEQQRTVLQMVCAVESGGREEGHAMACELLSEQLRDVIDRCKSWDYIDLS
ncbi:MAG: hypothetical protein IKG22_15430 [Atopobiaceae bacterium]|nr:hypothetical protein [Atopobiaceae bacterium]